MNADALKKKLDQDGHGHALNHWDRLDEHQRSALAAQLLALDLEHLRRLYERRHENAALPSPDRIGPVPVIPPGATEHADLGEQALRRGEVAVLLVAGGQGSRLGFERPKGMYPVGP
ncbi:MAG: UTP--glucose-1-phosphate uridylyltransferase, partial [Gemmataceae bacterium]